MGISLSDVQRGYDAWAAKPHNAKWVRRLDGTPIANDVVVNIFDTLRDQLANCCHCGRIVDTRERSEGGDDFGAELSDGRWACSIEFWDAVVEPGFVPPSPQPSLVGQFLPTEDGEFNGNEETGPNEPVLYVSEKQLEQCIGTYLPTRKEAEGNFQLPLYRNPPPQTSLGGDEDYKAWYDEAMIAANEAGFAGMSAAQVIRQLTYVEWRDMATAPKTGEEFIARTGAEWSAFSCFWDGEAFVHFDKDDGFIRYSPKEWMPLPAALATSEASDV